MSSLLISERQFATELETDALHLWITALRSAAVLRNPSGDSSLLDLFPKVISLLAENWAVLGSVIDILEGYLLLDANTVMQVRCAIVHLPSQHSHATNTELCLPAVYRTPTTSNEGRRESYTTFARCTRVIASVGPSFNILGNTSFYWLILFINKDHRGRQGFSLSNRVDFRIG